MLKMKNLEKNSKHTLVEKNRDSPSIEKLERMKRVVVTVAKHSTFMKKNGDTSYRVVEDTRISRLLR